MKKIFIIAGEASGDLLGSKLINELKNELAQKNGSATFIGVGGKLMCEQGFSSIFPMEELSVMGFLEVVPHLKKLLSLINQTAQKIIDEQPDYVVTIDSPDFCFRVVKRIRKLAPNLKTKFTHLIAPSVWAYREGRAEKISKLYDLLLAILPFEPPYFEKYGLKTVFIGHPITENAPDFSKKSEENLALRKKFGIKNDDIVICLTPGSRSSEVKKIFPEFIGAINLLREKIPNLKVLIPLVEKTKELVLEMAPELKVEFFFVENGQKKSAFFASDFALAKSGTNTLEFSLYKIPLVIAYKINFLTHFIVKRMVKITFASLINLILDAEVIPEMLQKNCTAPKLAAALENLISNKNLAEKQVAQSQQALVMMGLNSAEIPSKKAAKEILSL
jgi:lipid-A-disaccharide synthase